jgi:hypothetical protein
LTRRPTAIDRDDLPFRGHEYGWYVYKAGRKIAELEFLHIDGHCYMFKLLPRDGDESDFASVFCLRPADSNVVLRNRTVDDFELTDDEVCMARGEQSIVSMKDFRPPHSLAERLWAKIGRVLGAMVRRPMGDE